MSDTQSIHKNKIKKTIRKRKPSTKQIAVNKVCEPFLKQLLNDVNDRIGGVYERRGDMIIKKTDLGQELVIIDASQSPILVIPNYMYGFLTKFLTDPPLSLYALLLYSDEQQLTAQLIMKNKRKFIKPLDDDDQNIVDYWMKNYCHPTKTITECIDELNS